MSPHTNTRAVVVVVVVASSLVVCGAARLPFSSPVFVNENSLSPVAKYDGVGQSSYEMRDFVKMKHAGPRMSRVAVGGRLELECEANGSPPPSLQWLHNSLPVTQGLDENNSIGGLRLGTVKSRLVIDCVTPAHQGTYTCVATSGTETAISQPSLLFVQGNNGSGPEGGAECQAIAAPPRITTWSPNMLETIGDDVVLPCVAEGTPLPQVYWIYGQNQLITANNNHVLSDTRYKVLESGDLMISAVRWSDMGQFTCVAESPLGRDTVSTFLYPMSKDR